MFGLRRQIFTQLHHVFKDWSLTIFEKGHIRRLISVLVLWSLWVARNKTKHGEQRYSFHGVVTRVNHCLSLIVQSDMLHYKHWRGDLEVVALFDVHPLKPRPKKPMKLMWVKPPGGIVKLNIDGAFKDAWGVSGVSFELIREYCYGRGFLLYCFYFIVLF
ncbi:hypothetical protein LIER_09964 [Lithospermum erythrorhizon]|uniref:Uncharacterized protein n=1 Tax=Lithospermum erythrorhizon TaxID=34254 RepID=A0AAV3PJW3_LITER